MERGWIKVWRKSMDNPYFSNPKYVALWVWILILATHKEIDMVFDKKRITLKPGQFITGRKSLSRKTGIKPTTLERLLETLEIEQQIGQQTTTKNRLITVINWDKYQKDGQQSGQRTDNERTTNGHKQEHKNIEKVEENITTTKVVGPAAYGREDINWLIGTFTERLGFKPSGSKDRNYATHLLRNFTRPQLEMMLLYCATDRFAPRVGSLEKMWFKRGDIIAGLQKKSANPDVVDLTNLG